MGNRKKNPFRLSYLGIAVICCLALNSIFYCTEYRRTQETLKQYNLKKAELMLGDLEAWLELMEEVSLRIAISNEYQPRQFRRNKYNESVLLQDFGQYRFYCTLAEECFLYYSGNTVFHSSGFTMELSAWLKELSAEEQKNICDKLKSIVEAELMRREPCMLTAAGDIYVLIPIQVSEITGRSNAVLGFVIRHSDLEERFSIVSGGITGRIVLYSGSTVVFSNSEEIFDREQKDVLAVSSADGSYTLCYLPEKESYLKNGLFTTQLLLAAVSMILLLLVANNFAERAYKPIIHMSNKYRKEISMSEDLQFRNTLEEIDCMMDSMLQNNMIIQEQISQKQEMLKNQILRLVLEGSGTFDVKIWLERLQIRLPGPFFYVVTVSFEEEDVTEEFLLRLQRELEGLSNEAEKEFVYAVCDHGNKRLNAICSIDGQEKKEELTENICAVAESFAYEPLTGSGNLYQTLSRLPASWLESMDNLSRDRKTEDGEQPLTHAEQGIIRGAEELYRICIFLGEGNEQGALENLNRLVSLLGSGPVSLLMQQYVFADFLSRVTGQAFKSRIELSRQSISLVVSAKSVEDFKKAAEELIHEFCETYRLIRDRQQEMESCRIYEYVNEHFAEYDLSIEKVAQELDTSTAAVRQAVYEHTGKMYKDYLMWRRIEYARVLLREEITVDEVCRRVGYSSISYFTRLFKSVTGVTPAKYKIGSRNLDPPDQDSPVG